MTNPLPTEATVRNRWLALVGSRILGVAGALLGLVLVGQAATTGQRILGAAIVLSALLMIAVVPAALARRWRTPRP